MNDLLAAYIVGAILAFGLIIGDEAKTEKEAGVGSKVTVTLGSWLSIGVWARYTFAEAPVISEEE